MFRRGVWAGLLASVLAIACDDSNDRPSGVGSGARATTAGSDTAGGAEGGESPGAESSFLVLCDTSRSCGEGLRCISGVCTRRCELGETDCTALADAATCTARYSSVYDEFFAVCDVGCSGDADCLALGEDHRCKGGVCSAGTSRGPFHGYPLVFPCPAGDIAGDAFDYLQHRIKGDLLEIRIGYRGAGPSDSHEFWLCYGPDFSESSPVQTVLTLRHDANGDVGHSDYSAQRTLTFDLSPLASAYEAAYQTDGGLIQTNYSLYAFGALSCDERTTAAHSQMLDAAQWAQGSSHGCVVEVDCTTDPINVSCAHSCSAASVNEASLRQALDYIDSEICGDFADVCPEAPTPPCEPPRPPACVRGSCE